MSEFCVYITIYTGNKMPPFYIGSSSVTRVKNGYNGSVSSKIYKPIWDLERKENPHLFKTKIVSLHETRVDATDKERSLQKQLKVATSPMYINMSYASPDGACGTSLSGKLNPMYGKKRYDLTEYNQARHGMRHPPEFGQKISKRVAGELNPMYGKHHTDASKEKIRAAVIGRVYDTAKCKHCQREIAINNLDTHETTCNNNPNKTQKFKHKRPRSEDARLATSERMKAQPKKTCPHCGTMASPGNFTKWHGDNCRNK